MTRERKFFNGPVPWLIGLLSADVGVLAGLAACFAFGYFSNVTANDSAYLSIFGFFLVVAAMILVAISNQRLQERRALRRPIADACGGLYTLSLEVQHFASMVRLQAEHDANGRATDIGNLRDLVTRIERAAKALAPSTILDPFDRDRIVETGRNTARTCDAGLAGIAAALRRESPDRRGDWTQAARMADEALVAIGRVTSSLQAHV